MALNDTIIKNHVELMKWRQKKIVMRREII